MCSVKCVCVCVCLARITTHIREYCLKLQERWDALVLLYLFPIQTLTMANWTKVAQWLLRVFVDTCIPPAGGLDLLSDCCVTLGSSTAMITNPEIHSVLTLPLVRIGSLTDTRIFRVLRVIEYSRRRQKNLYGGRRFTFPMTSFFGAHTRRREMRAAASGLTLSS